MKPFQRWYSEPARGVAVTLAVMLIALSGCSGGDRESPAEAGVGSGGTGPGTASVGPITGFGSIYVGGVRFEDDTADIRSDDGQRLTRDQLDLGMWVEVVGSVAPSGDAGRADSVRVVRAVRGVVLNVDAARNTLGALGLNVEVSASTIFGSGSGLASLKTGDVVDIYGALDARALRVSATRIERVNGGGIGALPFLLRGTITALTPTTLQLGALSIDYSGARVEAPQGLAVGTAVTVASSVAPIGATWQATLVTVVPNPATAARDVTLEGVVSEFTSLADLRIDNTAIDARGAQVSGGNPSDIRLGARLLVRGSVAGGVLVASEIRVLGNGGGPMPMPFIALGNVTNFGSISDFRIRNTRVNAAAATFVNGTAADLTANRRVEARGQIAGGVLQATQVTFLP
jgi:hypothetical protein